MSHPPSAFGKWGQLGILRRVPQKELESRHNLVTVRVFNQRYNSIAWSQGFYDSKLAMDGLCYTLHHPRYAEIHVTNKISGILWCGCVQIMSVPTF